MENSWAAKPLGSKSSTLRRWTLLTSLLSAALGFFCMVYFASAGWDELHWAAGHPAATVFFLTWLYYIQFLNAVLICICSLMCLIGMCISPHGVPGTCRWPGVGNVSTILILSRALRVTFWTAFFTIWVIVLVGQDTCRDVASYDMVAQKSQLCNCLTAEGGLTTDEQHDRLGLLRQACSPKTFHTCLRRESTESYQPDIFGLANHTLCGYQCLNADRPNVYDRVECDATRCLALDPHLGCYWGEYACPARLEDFNDVYLDHPYSFCRYSLTGDLISTNFREDFPMRTDLDAEIHDDLHDVTRAMQNQEILGANSGVTMHEILADAGFLANGTVCVFMPGDSSCAERDTCTQKLLAGADGGAYVGPTDANGNPLGGTYPRSNPDPRPGIWSAEACAEYVMETEPSANGATFSGIKYRRGTAFEYPFCYAEFNTDGTVLENGDDDSILWSTCSLTPTDNVFFAHISGLTGNDTVIPARCRLEWADAQNRIDAEVKVCNAVVDGALFVVCIFLLCTTYWFSRIQFSYYLTIDPNSVAGPAASAAGGGGEGAHVQLEDVGGIAGSSDIRSAAAETAHDARP